MDQVLQIATLMATCVAIIGLAFTVWSFRKTVHAQMLTTYAQRFEQIVDQLPRELFLPQQPITAPETPELSIAALKYFSLCFEEFYLHQRGYFARDLWHMWEHGMSEMLAHPILRREWQYRRQSYLVYPEFLRFVDRCVEGNQTIAPGRPTKA